MLPDYEKLGVFYLGTSNGGPADAAPSAASGAPYLYDSRHLLTHAVVIGMTGSGKTGLSVDLLEEAAIDGIPAIVIDPKGDLANLALTFPNVAPEDFAAWAPAGREPAAEAEAFRRGLAESAQDPQRIQRFRDAARVRIFTPGSRAGTPVAVLASLRARPGTSEEGLLEDASSVASSLLALVGIDADPRRSREHILLAQILLDRWRRNEDVPAEALVHAITEPGLERIGAMSLETFYPAKERFELAVAFNALLAAPGFDAWLAGPPLDIDGFLFGKDGKPTLSVFSIAHLEAEQRMFFVTLLLGEILRWMRRQPGTQSLRALLFMDEIFGFCPPVAAPPSKAKLLALLKQARAFGLGIVLATQNPVDLDYKGLGNAGTWFLGRLQTERDRKRVLDGLAESAAVAGLDRDTLEKSLAALPPRTFLVHDIHAEGPRLMRSRWALSYLRGPMTREELGRLAPDLEAEASGGSPPSPAASSLAMPVAPAEKGLPGGARPVLPPGIEVVFLEAAQATSNVYKPAILGVARVGIADPKLALDVRRDVAFVAPYSADALALDWDRAQWLTVPASFQKVPTKGIAFAPLAPAAALAKSYTAWAKGFGSWLAQTQGVSLWRAKSLGLVSTFGEDEGTFRGRITHGAREARDQRLEALRAKYAPKIATLQDRIRKAEEGLRNDEREHRGAQMDVAMSVATTFAGMLFGRSTLKKATRVSKTAVRGARRTAKESADVEARRKALAVLQERWARLQEEVESAAEVVAREHDSSTLELERVMVRPKRTAIEVRLVALAWWR